MWLSAGASYRYSHQIVLDLGDSHILFEDGTFCVSSQANNADSSHCNAATAYGAILLSGETEPLADVVSLGAEV